ncbi:MAG: condensation domain-containing protein, partial [Candidatus Binatia bacterium]
MHQNELIISNVGNTNLTRNQLQVWIAQNLLTDQPIYNLPVALTIFGKIEPCLFQQAFRTLVNSSDALRTVFDEIRGVPARRVIPQFTKDLRYLDLSDASDPHAVAKKWMQERCVLPFDLKSPLFDAALIKLSADEFVWYLNIHHLISDAWSVQLIYQWLSRLYELAVGRDLPYEIRLNSFQDYAASEREEKNSARHRKAEAYWKEKLSVDL